MKFSGKSTRRCCTPEWYYRVIAPIATYQLIPLKLSIPMILLDHLGICGTKRMIY